MTPITIKKLDVDGQVVTAYQGQVLERTAHWVFIEARWRRPDLDLGYVTFQTGDRFLETHYADRWYAVFQIQAADGRLKGWYVNFSRPATITQDEVRAVDLRLDLFVHPDGRQRLLDLDEYVELDLPQTDPVAHQAVQAALAQLRAQVAARHPPFDRLTP
jgi:predicted RNA-binding protein associated with RNAse of E/G family